MEPFPPERVSLEKHNVVHTFQEDATAAAGPTLTKNQLRRMRIKVDLKVVSMLSIILGISIIDRINIGSARVLGMDPDLGINLGPRYSVCLLVFFPAYFLAELPSNMMLVRVGVKFWLSFLTFGFGLCVLGMGFSSNWQVLAFLRFMLGLFEGGIYPACVFIISSWYPRYKLQSRLSALYGVGTIASAFGGILAYGLSQMSGKRGMLGWRWVFIVEGAVSMVIGLVAYLFLQEFPDRATFLSPTEQAVIMSELKEDSGSGTTESLSWALFKQHSSDWFVYASTLIFMCVVIPTYGLAFFIPSILVGMGYTGVQATLNSAPPYAAGVGILILTAYLGDKFHRRGYMIIILAAMTMTGMLLVRPVHPTRVRYFGIYLAVMGAVGNQITIMSFNQNNIVGSSKRLLFSAFNIAGGAVGGIIGSTIFRSEDAPTYGPGLYTVVGLQCTMILMTLACMAVFWKANRRADLNGTVINGVEGWRYTL